MLFIGSSKAKTKSKKPSKALVRIKHNSMRLENVDIGQVLLCKMRGFAEWPCVVTSINGNSIHVLFYGDRTTHKTTIAHLFDFRHCIELILDNLKRLKSLLYQRSVREAEVSLGIPFELSILNHRK